MKAEFRTQFPFGEESQRLSRLFREIVNQNCWKEITGVFAYATSGGLTDLLDQISLLSNSPKTKWLFGLDDCLTEPSAIELAQSCSEDVRVVSLLSQKCRFHPKILHFVGSDKKHDLLVVGSANLTSNGLNQNAEAVSVLSAPSSSETATIAQTIAKLFELGYVPTELQLERYREAYTKARPLHKQIRKLGVNENESDNQKAERTPPGLDPTVATCCWIEVGKNTAMGRELEIKSLSENHDFLKCVVCTSKL
jgi:HKD family nuclease